MAQQEPEPETSDEDEGTEDAEHPRAHHGPAEDRMKRPSEDRSA